MIFESSIWHNPGGSNSMGAKTRKSIRMEGTVWHALSNAQRHGYLKTYQTVHVVYGKHVLEVSLGHSGKLLS